MEIIGSEKITSRYSPAKGGGVPASPKFQPVKHPRARKLPPADSHIQMQNNTGTKAASLFPPVFLDPWIEFALLHFPFLPFAFFFLLLFFDFYDNFHIENFHVLENILPEMKNLSFFFLLNFLPKIRVV